MSSISLSGSRFWFALAIGTVLLAANAAFAGPPSGTFPKVRNVYDAKIDTYAVANVPTHTLYIEGLAADLCFEAPGLFDERADGTARLTGILRSKTNPSLRFIIDAHYSNRIIYGDANFHPPMSPHLELQSAAYSNNGGPVDVDDFYYYGDWGGTLYGVGGMKGARVTFVKFMSSFQVGRGANGMNVDLGSSGWFTATTITQATNGPALPDTFNGDFNDNIRDDSGECARAAIGDNYNQTPDGHAILLPTGGFTFEDGATFVESANGTAHLSAIAVASADSTQRFQVEVDFSMRVNPGDVNYPPFGSPKQELKPAAYIEGGGPIDVNTWHYYQLFHGTMTGLDAFAGALLDVTRTGPAFQVGLGANGKNVGQGGSGWVNVVVLQPSSNPNFNLGHTCQGDFNFDFRLDCTEEGTLTKLNATKFGTGCPGYTGFTPSLDFVGSFAPGSVATLAVTGANGGSTGFLLLGANQANIFMGFDNCTLLVAPIVGIYGPMPMSGVGPGNGSYYQPIPLPLAMIPGLARVQAALDVMQGSFTMTNGVEVEIK